MKEEIRTAIGEQVTTLAEQSKNAFDAVADGDVARLEKALSIIEKVARIVLVVIGALGQARARK